MGSVGEPQRELSSPTSWPADGTMTAPGLASGKLRRLDARYRDGGRAHRIRYVGWHPRAAPPDLRPTRFARARPTDDLVDRLERAGQEQRAVLEADLAVILAMQSHPAIATSARLEHSERLLAGAASADRQLLTLLALRRAERSDGAEQARGLAARALASGSPPADASATAALLTAAVVLGSAGASREAEQALDGIIATAQRSRSHAVLAGAHARRGRERLERGELDEAQIDLDAALAASAGEPWETMIDDGRAQLLRLHTERGDLDRAESELRAWRADGPLPATTFGIRLLIERGRLRLVQGRPADAVADVEAAREYLGERMDSILFDWRRPLALAQHGLGRRQAALAHAHDAVDHARAWGAPRQLGAALATLGMIEGGASGTAKLHAAVEVLSASPARLELARALVMLGSLLRRAGEPCHARVELLSGRQIAIECKAHTLADLAEQEIAASGVTRRRRTELSGIAALTPSEQRVARLAARGLSNPEIAQALYITRKTVEMHLGNAYRKLEIKSRQQLQEALPADPKAGAPT